MSDETPYATGGNKLESAPTINTRPEHRSRAPPPFLCSSEFASVYYPRDALTCVPIGPHTGSMHRTCDQTGTKYCAT